MTGQAAAAGQGGAPVSQSTPPQSAPALGRTPPPLSKSSGGVATDLADTWRSAAAALSSFWAEAQHVPFTGQSSTGDDHLVGVAHPHEITIKRAAGAGDSPSLLGIASAVARASDHWHQDMRTLQQNPHFKNYRYALLAARMMTGTLSPLQAGIYIGAAALPLVDAKFPAASEAARHTLSAAAIVVDPLGFAAGAAALVAMRVAMQHASPDRRAFWQCMTFVLTRQISAHALGG